MVYEVIRSRYRVLIEAFVIAAAIFVIAFALGLYIESARITTIQDNYKKYEISSLDLRMQDYYFQTMAYKSCDIAVQSNFDFADQLYNSGLALERYEEANQITSELILDKQSYALLKTELWLNTLLLKQRCGMPFDTVVYFYYGDPRNNKDVSEQKIISTELKNVKERYGDKVILLPIAADFNLNSINLQMKAYNVTSIPAVLINENTVLYGYHSAEEIEKYIT